MSLFTAERNFIKMVLFSFLLVLFVVPVAFAQVFYSVPGNGDFNTLGNWNSERDGSGSAPGAFTGNDFVVESGDVMSLSDVVTIRNLEIESGGAVDLVANTLTVSGNILINGSLDDNSGGSTLEVGGNFTINDGASWANTSFMSITFSGSSGDQVINGTYSSLDQLVFDYFTVNAPGATVTNSLESEIFVSIQFALASGTFEAGSATYTFAYGVDAANVFNKTGGSLTAQGSIFKIVSNRSVRFSIDASTSFNRIVHNPSVNSTLTFAGAGVYTIGNELLLSPRSLGVRYAGSASLGYTPNVSSLTYTTNNNLDLSNEWVTSNSPTSVTISGGGTYSISDTDPRNVSNLTVSNGTLDLNSGGLTVSTQMTVNGGSVVANSETITIDNNGTLALSSGSLNVDALNINAGATFQYGNGTLTLGGAPSYAAGSALNYTFGRTAGLEWPDNIPNVTISGVSITGLAATDGTRGISNNLALTGGGSLTLAVGNADNLQIGGVLTVGSGTLTLQGGALNVGTGATVGNGSIVSNNGNIAITGILDINGGTVNSGSGSIATTSDLQNSGSVITNGTLVNVGGSLDNQTGGSVTTSGGNIVSAAALTNNGTINASGGTGLITVSAGGSVNNNAMSSGTGGIAITGDLDNQGTVTANGLLLIAGDLTIGASHTVNAVSDGAQIQGTLSLGYNSRMNSAADVLVYGDVIILGGATIGQATAGTLVMGGASTSGVDIEGVLELFNFTVNKTGGSGVVVSAVEGTQLRFNDNATLTVQSGILSMSESAQIRDAGGSLDISDNNLTLSIDASGTLRTGGTSIVGFASFDLADQSTIEFTGTLGSEDIPAGTFGNITVNNSYTSGVNLAGNVTLRQNSTINVASNRRFNLSGYSITHDATPADDLVLASGSQLYTGGTAITGFSNYDFNGTVVFDGTSADETLPAGVSGDAFNLTVNKSGGSLVVDDAVTFGGADNALRLINGLITFSGSGALTLAAGTDVPAAGPASYVDGPVSREFSDAVDAGGTVERLLPVGSDGVYRPVRLDFFGLSGDIVVTATQNEAAPTGTLPTGISAFATGLNRYWTVDQAGTGSFTSYNMDLRYTDASDPQASLSIISGTNGVSYDNIGTSTTFPVAGRIQAVFTTFSDFAIGRSTATKTWDGEASTVNWSDAANWNDNILPQAGDIIDLDAASPTDIVYNSAVTQNQFASINVGANISLTLQRATNLNLTAGANALVVASGGELIFGGSSVNMGGSTYDAALTDFIAGSSIEYTAGSVYADNYDGNLVVNGVGSTSGSVGIVVGGNLEKQSTTAFSTSNAVTVGGNYINTAGNATFNGGLTVTGDVLLTAGVVGGTSTFNGTNLTVNGGSLAGTVTLSGSAAQTIAGSATAAFANLTIDNANGISLSTPVTVSGVLDLTNGLVSTASGMLTLGSGASVTNASAGSYVSGAMRVTGAGNKFFPIGKNGFYRPVELLSVIGSSPVVEFELFNTDPGGMPGDGINNISIVRYWTTTIQSGTFTSGQVKLYWGADDGVTASTTIQDLRVVVSGAVDGTYDDAGYTAASGDETAGQVTSGQITGDTGIPYYFTLGSASGDNPLPVELAAFEAMADYRQVTLNWTTASELNNLGFNVYRQDSKSETWAKVNTELIAGQGNTSSATDYTFVDAKIAAGETYQYKLESLSANGLSVEEKTIEVVVPIPDQYVLFNNYPNPFNPTTNIRFQLPETQSIKLFIYDMNGSLVNTLINNQTYASGEHIVTWDATDRTGNRVATGIYLYRFQAGSFIKTGKMVLVK